MLDDRAPCQNLLYEPENTVVQRTQSKNKVIALLLADPRVQEFDIIDL
jgi:hypothetical protein